MPRVSAYVPCYNNRATIRRAVESVLAQTVRPDEILVVDDGSVDDSVDTLSGLGIRVVRHETNLGRGATRARAMRELQGDFVVCCDATNILDDHFVERALPWFGDADVVAVVGRLTQRGAAGVVDRWRGRHLFKMDAVQGVQSAGNLSTSGAVVRASAVAAVGGFNPRLRHTEDGDLGRRLLNVGLRVVYDPALEVVSAISNTLPQVLERYWRWYADVGESISWHGYLRTIAYSIKAMAAADLRARDPLSIPISLAVPHYQFWRSMLRRWRRSRRSTT